MILHGLTLKAAPLGVDEVHINSSADNFADRRATIASILTDATLTTCTLNSPTLVTPSLGVASVASLNKVLITTPASVATLTLANNSSLITSGAFALTLTTTAATNVTLPTTGTLATLNGVETFTNKTFTAPTFNNPSFTAPNIGDATGSSLLISGLINKLNLTQPAVSATLTLANGSSLITVGAFAVTLTATAATALTLPTTGTLSTLAGAESLSNKTLVGPVLGVATGTSLAVTGLITSSSPSAGIGYATGAGASVTQITSRTTAVTINAVCGSIQTDTASIAAGDSAEFVVNNSAVALGDVVNISCRSGKSSPKSRVSVNSQTAGTFTISVLVPSGATAETGAIIINFAIIKAVSA